MRRDYGALDSAIIRAIRADKTRFYVIYAYVSDVSAVRNGGSRVVDSRLQALRKAGFIRFSGGEWKIAERDR